MESTVPEERLEHSPRVRGDPVGQAQETGQDRDPLFHSLYQSISECRVAGPGFRVKGTGNMVGSWLLQSSAQSPQGRQADYQNPWIIPSGLRGHSRLAWNRAIHRRSNMLLRLQPKTACYCSSGLAGYRRDALPTSLFPRENEDHNQHRSATHQTLA